MEEKDAVIVGARCAGATLAIELARRDWDVLLVDRDTFPSDTVSTHFFYPNTVSRFAQLGILDTLRSSHRPSSSRGGRASRTRGRTCATPSAVRSTRPAF
jgi:2-polyprenyl-6-methoxyphenol hydroxylase-like FAD-dependent oxidoreductase